MSTQSSWQCLSDPLYLFEDTCNVYALLREGWTATPAVGRLSLAAQGRDAAGFYVRIPASFAYPRMAIAADVTFDGRRLGQIAEGTVELAR